jgi:hypothetical protein
VVLGGLRFKVSVVVREPAMLRPNTLHLDGRDSTTGLADILGHSSLAPRDSRRELQAVVHDFDFDLAC